VSKHARHPTQRILAQPHRTVRRRTIGDIRIRKFAPRTQQGFIRAGKGFRPSRALRRIDRASRISVTIGFSWSRAITLAKRDASAVLGTVGRNDQDHDIAAWFGVNEGWIAEVKAGSHGSITAPPVQALPPKGPPSGKGGRLRAAVDLALGVIGARGEAGLAEVEQILESAETWHDADET
jgi:hypothetical protein